jgi:hypothetical protein
LQIEADFPITRGYIFTHPLYKKYFFPFVKKNKSLKVEFFYRVDFYPKDSYLPVKIKFRFKVSGNKQTKEISKLAYLFFPPYEGGRAKPIYQYRVFLYKGTLLFFLPPFYEKKRDFYIFDWERILNFINSSKKELSLFLYRLKYEARLCPCCLQ